MSISELDKRVESMMKRYGVEWTPDWVAETFEYYNKTIDNDMIVYKIKVTHDGSSRKSEIEKELISIHREFGYHIVEDPKHEDTFFETYIDIRFASERQ